jgi:hypothetical protein
MVQGLKVLAFGSEGGIKLWRHFILKAAVLVEGGNAAGVGLETRLWIRPSQERTAK